MNPYPQNWKLTQAMEELRHYDQAPDEKGTIIKDVTIKALESLLEDVREDRIGGIALIVFTPDNCESPSGALSLAFIPDDRLKSLVGSLQAFLKDMSMKYLQCLFGRPAPIHNPQDLN